MLFTNPEVLIPTNRRAASMLAPSFEIYTIINQLAAEGKGI